METTIKGPVPEKTTSWLDKPVITSLVLNAETILFTGIVILAIFTRFFDLGSRVMSHDENSHVYYSWRLYKGQGFAHDPLMHGTLQFHLLAMSYFMFGDNDFTARIPAVLFSIATVAFLWFYRRYLGRVGALVGAILMLISPYMLYYGRYVRNEAFVGLFGVITLWAILRYIETGQARYSYWLVAITALHFTTKETSFIYTAQAMIFLALYLIYRLANQPWQVESRRSQFYIALIVGLILIGVAAGFALRSDAPVVPAATETATPDLEMLPDESGLGALPLVFGGIGVVALATAAVLAVSGYSWEALRKERAFGLLVLLTTLVLPHLAAFPVRLAGWTIPTNASEVTALTTTDIFHIAVFLVPMALISIAAGLFWDRRLWLVNAGIFYAIFTVFFTTVFTNGAGFFTGLVGSLGYWLEQQGVQRGSQPWYYYAGVQVPVYEYLPALGSLLALVLYFLGRRPRVEAMSEEQLAFSQPEAERVERPPVLALLGFWVVTSLVAYTIAGEKMPWLTVHITLPMILLAGWAFGELIESIDWSAFRSRRGILAVLVLLVFLVGLVAAIGSLLGPEPPFQGKELDSLRATSTFLMAFLTAVASGVALFYLVRTWTFGQFGRVLLLAVFSFLALLTARTAFTAAYISYDDANELLVYAHSAGGVKDALDQIEDISRRTTNGLAMVVAYDNHTSYPYLWYLRNYPNARYFGSDPTRSLRDAPAILVGEENYGKIEPVVANGYYAFDYIRLWWPNQDYYNLTWERIKNAITDPKMRSAVFKIWLNRDYTQYGQVTNQDLSLPKWSPAARMRLYIRKDVANMLWDYGVAPTAQELIADPYEGKGVNITPQAILGGVGQQAGLFNRPRDLAVAPDGTLFVIDTDNHRIQHINQEGVVLNVWGEYGDINVGEAPGGMFNQPWGLGVGPDGSVYVADTWNNRIQKFTAEGEFVKMWGYFGQAEVPEAFWGPRDVAVDPQGRVYVTDTGNKRVVIFDADGNYINQFGSAGMGPSQFDEPVGIAIDGQGLIYIADTWNQRIQVLQEDEQGNFAFVREWEVVAWYGQSVDNKPYLAVDDTGRLFASDPEGARVLQFSTNGEFIRYWGDPGEGVEGLSMVGGVTVDQDGQVWVADAGTSRLLEYQLP